MSEFESNDEWWLFEWCELLFAEGSHNYDDGQKQNICELQKAKLEYTCPKRSRPKITSKYINQIRK